MKRIAGKIDGIRVTKNDTIEVFVEGYDDAFYIPYVFVESFDSNETKLYLGGNIILRYDIDKAHSVVDVKPNADGEYSIVTTNGVIVRREKDGVETEVTLNIGDRYQAGDKVVLRKDKMRIRMASLTKSNEQLVNAKTETETELIKAQLLSVSAN